MALLEVTNLGIAFGGLQAVAQLDMKMEKGQLYGLIGPNGAGKTTVFNMLTGVYKPTEGDIILDGRNITGQQPAKINQAGIARTFQNIRLFNQMSVLDNVKIGLHNQVKYSMWTGIFRLPGFREKERRSFRRGSRSNTLSRSSAMASFESLRVKAPISRFSCTERWLKTRRPSGTWASPSRMILCASMWLIFWPMKSISPLFSLRRPEMACIVVVLPAPLAPIRVTISPSFTWKEISRMAWMEP